MDGWVDRQELIKAARNKNAIQYWTRSYTQAIPCRLNVNGRREAADDSKVLITVRPNKKFGAFSVEVPKAAVYVRHRFIRPSIPFSLWDAAENMAGQIREAYR